MNIDHGLSVNEEMSAGTANSFVTKEMSLTLNNHVKTLMNKHISQMTILISINLDKAFFCKKKFLILSNILIPNGLISIQISFLFPIKN